MYTYKKKKVFELAAYIHGESPLSPYPRALKTLQALGICPICPPLLAALGMFIKISNSISFDI